MPALSVLIVNYNGLRHLDECLGSLRAQTFRDFEIILVDNASTDGSVAHLEARFPEVRIVRSPINAGFAGGNNLGLPHCGAPAVLLLNNDTRVEPEALGNLAAALAERPGIGAFACLLLKHSDPSRIDSAGDTLYTAGPTFSFHGYPASILTGPRKVTAACAGAACYRKTLIDRLGGFDEDLFLLLEDVDLSFRARHAGEEILLLPDVRILHKGSASMGGASSALSVFYSERNYPLVVLKTFPLPALLRFLPSLILSKILRLLILARKGKKGSVAAFIRGNLAVFALIPRFLRKRRAVLAQSALSSREFWRLLRPGWFRERLAFRRGHYDIPA